MALLALQVELRLHIYAFIAQLSPNQYQTISLECQPRIPAICRTARQFRCETLPLYMSNSEFAIQISTTTQAQDEARAILWLQFLGNLGLPHIRNLQLNCHWSIRHPSRHEGHVGFYVRLAKVDSVWRCTVGTYPAAKDTRGRRLESVELLREALRRTVLDRLNAREAQMLRGRDLEVAVQAARIVARHPIEVFGLDGKGSDMIWKSMEKELATLEPSFEDDEVLQASE